MLSSKSLQSNWRSSWPGVDERRLPHLPSAKGRGRSPVRPGPRHVERLHIRPLRDTMHVRNKLTYVRSFLT